MRLLVEDVDERGADDLALLFGLLNPGDPQLLLEPPLAVAAAGERARLVERIGRVVDVAEPRELIGDGRKIGLAIALPAPLAQFPAKIIAQLGAGRREALDIT